ncbi:MAG: hypothetical protein LH465_01200 [Sphingomonas bacterium]|nr:hypothetical protein [Sphingomonas bacterium]
MTEQGEGERIEARRRRTFWMSLGVLMIGGALAGLFTGIAAGGSDLEPDAIWARVPQPLAVAITGALLIAFSYATWRFYKAIDEVELADNLWGSTASYYLYATLFPLWWALGKAGVLPEPNDWAIYLIALGGGGVVYLWRKWRAR